MKIARVRQLCKRIDVLTVSARQLAVTDVQHYEIFKLCVAAAYAKNLEFNLHVQGLRRRDNAFFLLGTLRGLCEDYIVLRFISRFRDESRERITRMLFGRAIGQSLKAQVTFFEAHRPYQLIVSQPVHELDAFLATIARNLKKIGSKNSWGPKTAFPTVKYMAREIGESDLYDYLYHATSCLVHFNPKVLAEMGWGPLPGQMRFSATNFHHYYFDFCLCYGALLLVKACEAFEQELAFPVAARDVVQELRTLLEEPGRWPELVTHEAMNLKPTGVDYARHIAMAMMKQENGSSKPTQAQK